EQVGDLAGPCQIGKPEQAAARVEQAELDKLINGAVGELAQRSNLTGRVGPMQTVGDCFPDPLEKAALAYHWNPIAARSGQLVRWSAVIQQRPPQLANNEHVGLSGNRLAGRSAM